MIKDFYQIHLHFQNFMLQKGYVIREREKLISPIFPTTFTVSGGPDLAYKFWQGDKNLVGNHIVNQPCIRHWDIETTGDGKHLSFFNMFVADSINGFTRKEILNHFIEFFTQQLHLEISRFYGTYFGGGNIKGTEFNRDEEMKNILLSIGFSPQNIISTTIDNPMECFVANTVEPVGGPRSEFFYDLRKDRSRIESAEQFWGLEKEGKILEFFTHVLYNVEVKTKEEQEDKEPVFNFKKMDNVAIAAGFGPQRLMRIFESTNDIGDISIFSSLKKCLGNIPQSLHKQEVIVCDHIRGIVFLVNDGILELHGSKNRSRRYLFRKYFRNFKENFELLPISDRSVILGNLITETVSLFSILFPNFENKRNYIVEKISEFYNKFDNEKH